LITHLFGPAGSSYSIASTDHQEVLIFTRLSHATPDDIACCGHGCAANRRLQPEPLVGGKCTGRVIDSQDEFVSLLKSTRLAVIPAHDAARSVTRVPEIM